MADAKPVYAWKQAPFIRLVIPLICGVLLQDTFNFSLLIISIILGSAILILMLSAFLRFNEDFHSRWIIGVFIQLAIFFFGMAVMQQRNILNDQNRYGHHMGKEDGFVVKIDKPETKAKTFKAIATVLYAGNKPAKGKVLLYFIKNDSSAALQSGDVVWLKNKLQPVSSSGNPGAFDYGKYMARQQIFHQAFLYQNDWQALNENRKGVFKTIMQKSVTYEENVLDRYIDGKEENALAKALLTGNRSTLDRELVKAYSNAGVVHLMAISGLHLGLIYILLLKFTKLLPGLSRKKNIRLVFVIVGMWFFALLTGAAPSVMRAAVMFSFLCVGEMFNRNSSSYNALSASAFLLLCFDPMLLFNVGFQLSYSAVLGILILQRPIANWLYFENKILVYAWQLVSVSIAAQLFTLPLCVYYFHQLPLLFMVSNLVAIPVASAGLWLGVFLIMFGWIPLVATVLGKLVFWIFSYLNGFVRYIDSLNFVTWSGFYPNQIQVILLYAIIIAAIWWLLSKNKMALKYALFFTFLISVSEVVQKWDAHNQQKLVVYNISSAAAADIFWGRNVFGIGNNVPDTVPDIVAARRTFKANDVLNILKKSAFEGNDFYSGPLRILHIKESADFPVLPEKIKVDFLLISNNAKIDISELSQTFNTNFFIFDATNKRYRAEAWKKQCEELHLRSHDIASEGAMVINF